MAAPKRSKGEDQPERLTGLTLAQAVRALEKDHGPNLVVPASRAILDVPRIPCGIFALDFALGGGFPAARSSMVWGRKGACKTTTALKLVAGYQALCGACYRLGAACVCSGGPVKPRVVWFDLEKSYDRQWAACHGVREQDDADEEWLHISRPDYAEQAVDVIDALMRVEEVGLVVIDSIACMVPRTEVEESAVKQQQALQAKLISKLFRKVGSAMNYRERTGRVTPTLVCVNQVREKLTRGGPVVEMMPGGHQMRHAQSVIVRLRPRYGGGTDQDGRSLKPYEWETKKAKDYTAPLRFISAFLVEHSKVSAPQISGDFALVLRPYSGLRVGEVDDMDTVIEQAARWRLIPREGAKIRLDVVDPAPEGTRGNGEVREFANREELRAFWLREPAEFARAKAAVIRLAYADARV